MRVRRACASFCFTVCKSSPVGVVGGDVAVFVGGWGCVREEEEGDRGEEGRDVDWWWEREEEGAWADDGG